MSWLELRKHLFLSLEDNLIPDHWRVEDILHSLHPFATMEEETLKRITLILGKLGITKAGHMREPVGIDWKPFVEKMARTQGILVDIRDLTSQFLIAIFVASRTIEERNADLDL